MKKIQKITAMEKKEVIIKLSLIFLIKDKIFLNSGAKINNQRIRLKQRLHKFTVTTKILNI